MPEEVAPHNSGIDPSLRAGASLQTPELKVRFTTFEEAQTAEKQLADTFIDNAIDDTFKIGGESVTMKGYLDKTEATESDNDIIASPQAIADVFLRTTKMLVRNLKVLPISTGNPVEDEQRKERTRAAQDSFKTGLQNDSPETTKQLVDWCEGRARKFPVDAMEYKGFLVDGEDVLDDNYANSTLHPNFKIQRQLAGTFIVAYSDNRVVEKVRGQEVTRDKRVYLNPDIMATPDIFEQLLKAANQAGLSIKLKMLQRAPELATVYKRGEMVRRATP